MGRMRKKALRALALLTGCIGLAAFVLACSKPADNSTAGAEATIQRQEADWLKAIGAFWRDHQGGSGPVWRLGLRRRHLRIR